ncbi:Hypothetical protein CINCED_3A024248 [Cinara cedri]|nr:Hypothetical protein CINCED_3A024248 [Cinara cedri]
MTEPLQNTMDRENQVLQNESVTIVEDTIAILDIKEEDDKPLSTTKAVIILAAIFLTSSLVLGNLYYNFPKFKDDEKKYIKIPFSIEDAENLGKVLDHYKNTHYVRVLLAISFCSIFLHTFALPGSFTLAILSGYLYPFPLALGTMCFCSAMGSTFCYLLSLTIGRKLAYAYFPDKIRSYASLVKKHEDNVLFVIMFWRIIPFFPSWLINICAPLVNVPLLPFWVGTFIGVAVPSGLSIQAGKTLKDLSSSTTLWSWSSVLFLVTFATLSLLPIIYKAKLRDKFD